MTRRVFISKTAAASLAGSWMLSGCGGGGGGGSESTPQTRSEADTTVARLQQRETELNGTLDAYRNASAQTVGGSSATRGLRAFTRTGGDASDFFRRGSIRFGDPVSEDPMSIPHYFANQSIGVWESYMKSLELAASQSKSQFVKMVAALRYAGYRSENSGAASTRSLHIEARDAAIATLRDTDTSVVEQFQDLVNNLKNGNFDTTILDLLTVSLAVLKTTIETLLSQDKIKGLAYTVLTYLAVDKLLEIVKEKSLSDLNFLGDDNIVISLGKMVIAALAVLGLMSLDKLAPSNSTRSLETRGTDTTEEETILAFLNGVLVQGQLVTLLFRYLSELLMKITEDTQATVDRLKQNLSDSAYPLTEEDRDLIDKLKIRSKVMAVFGLALKALFGILAANQNTLQGADGNPISFSQNGDAKDFEILFGSPINPYDEAFNEYLHGRLDEITGGTTPDSGTQSIFDVMTELSTQAYNFAVKTEEDAYNFTSQTEHDAYTFASRLADLAYKFTADTESDAVNFATQMTDLAYSFTMKIEDDAYQFALQGMEWGYLFASRGEEVGIMADRVLWMAGQIGQMADRIGEMADRIVYTEQLIVHTEILILDFGLLIYGGMKTIADFVLTGLALILDRQWYEPQTKDLIVTTIGKNVEQMMENMQEYALAVLENQNTLRQTTLDALDWILEFEALNNGSDTNTSDGNATA